VRGQDLNLRPLGYEPNELPDCSTPRYGFKIVSGGYDYHCLKHRQKARALVEEERQHHLSDKNKPLRWLP
jgi:hypothetical protein